MTGLRASVALATLAACMPTETVDIPAGVDWVALVTPASNDIEPGRLYRSDELPPIMRPVNNAWLVGYAEEQLLDEGIDAAWLSRMYVRPRRGTEPALTPPKWSRPLSGELPVPELSSDLLSINPPRIDVPQVDLALNHFEIEIPRITRRQHYATSDEGELLFSYEGGPVWSITPSGIEQHPPLAVEARRFTRYRGEFWVVTWYPVQLYRGPSTDALTWMPNRYSLSGIFHRDVSGRLLMITNDADVLDVETDVLVHSSSENWQRPTSLRAYNDVDGSLVAATTHWSFRWLPTGQRVSLGIDPTFAIVGDRILFALSDPADDTNAVFERNSLSELVAVADGTAVRSFEEIVDVLPFLGGAAVVESEGHLSWIARTGDVHELARLDRHISGAVTVDNRLYAYGISEDPDETPPPLVISVLSIADE